MRRVTTRPPTGSLPRAVLGTAAHGTWLLSARSATINEKVGALIVLAALPCTRQPALLRTIVTTEVRSSPPMFAEIPYFGALASW